MDDHTMMNEEDRMAAHGALFSLRRVVFFKHVSTKGEEKGSGVSIFTCSDAWNVMEMCRCENICVYLCSSCRRTTFSFPSFSVVVGKPSATVQHNTEEEEWKERERESSSPRKTSLDLLSVYI